MIPKVIHYCWFGNNPKPRLIKKCIASWRRLCPDYEIKEWNESNFDLDICPYVRAAYNSKKWAFVSDYARFYILNKYGGVYLDTDVQLLKPLDSLLERGAFAAFADEKIVATGLVLACEKDNRLCRAVLESYSGEKFNDDAPDKILAIGRRVTGILQENGLVLNGKEQQVFGFTIYPPYYFNPTNGDMRRKPDARAYSVHHYAATWFSPKKRFLNTLRRFIGASNMKKYYALKERLTGKK